MAALEAAAKKLDRQIALFTMLYGFNDGILMIRHDDAILAGSQAAKAPLPALRTAFNVGLRTGDIRYDGQGNTEGNESGKLIARQREGK